MLKSRQYRAKAAQRSELVKSSADAHESRKFQDLEERFVSLADSERDLDARSGAAALSRWDNEGGAVRDASPT
jgi:hypothetical protein